MNLKNKPPVFVPRCYAAEVEKMSKAALMDLVWDLAVALTGTEDEPAVMKTVRERAEIVLRYRGA